MFASQSVTYERYVTFLVGTTPTCHHGNTDLSTSGRGEYITNSIIDSWPQIYVCNYKADINKLLV